MQSIRGTGHKTVFSSSRDNYISPAHSSYYQFFKNIFMKIRSSHNIGMFEWYNCKMRWNIHLQKNRTASMEFIEQLYFATSHYCSRYFLGKYISKSAFSTFCKTTKKRLILTKINHQKVIYLGSSVMFPQFIYIGISL